MEHCPVCMEPTDRPQFPFSCGHSLCRDCARRMQQAELYRCPTCRAPREGMTAEQAAPREEPMGEVRPYASLFRWVSNASLPQPALHPPPERQLSPMAEDFAVAIALVQQEREQRAGRVAFDVSQLDEDIQSDLRALSELPTSLGDWQRRRRQQEEARALRAQLEATLHLAQD